ncbi:MAG: hypothetical protein NUW06_02095 [Candidatus Acetothermia bacterium]|jgi:hypothetical protein|nr:hypothetical protein [Candidatus Acetothermia bacterium]MDH7504639.1 hypothetical protein [Candidatus Acetothermia bacterium]
MQRYEVVFTDEEAGGARSYRVFESMEQALAFIERLCYPFQGHLLHELNVYEEELGQSLALEAEEEAEPVLHRA